MMVYLPKGEVIERDKLLLKLVDIQYKRNDIAFERGKFRVRGDTIEVWPASEEVGYRIELFGDEVDALSVIHPVTGEVIKSARRACTSTRPSTSSRRRPHPRGDHGHRSGTERPARTVQDSKASCSKRSG